MACNNSCNPGCEQKTCGCGYNAIIIIVLYILLAIILGSCLCF